MRAVEPKVYLLAEPRLIPIEDDVPGVYEWLIDMGADPTEVLSRMTGSAADKLTELAARRCYKSFQPGLNPNVTKIREDSKEYMENILKSGHGSVLEHANFTMAFEFVSRVFTHELVRHRAGCAYSQESMRYVRADEIGFWVPPEIAENDRAHQVFKDAIGKLEKYQRDLLIIFEQEFHQDFGIKKMLTSAFRRILPDGLATGIVATFNARAFRHVAQMRTSSAAEVEIRLAIGKACDLLFPRHPHLFQDFEKNEAGEYAPKYKKV